MSSKCFTYRMFLRTIVIVSYLSLLYILSFSSQLTAVKHKVEKVHDGIIIKELSSERNS